jgi:uncharacterized protein (DUF433 family)
MVLGKSQFPPEFRWASFCSIKGSRVPVSALFENLEDGVPIGKFVDLFPGVTLAQARAVLEHAARSALATA